ncbi:MAG: hypothetical protein GEU97_21035 [Actinophytocola sp.]|nr:hypothetical protein [Actinophytocola sp.]
MKVTIIGAGPSGLYLGILLAKAEQPHEVTVLERNPADATFGWGVVFSDETLGALRDADYPSYLDITDTFARWDAIDISYRDTVLRSRGHAFSAIARKQLLAILQRRAAELGVVQRFGQEIAGPEDIAALCADTDLLVGADGVRSVVREAATETFRPTITPQGGTYIWYGTDLVFDAFRFIFAESEHGLFQVHGYPFDEHASTFIVECPETTWRKAGLDEMSEADSIAFCEELFADELGGHRLMSNKSTWLRFPLVRNGSWHARVADTPVVLVGDAAHTAHFTIGSGTKLAMEDAIALGAAFVRHGSDNPAAALVHYERERKPIVERFQQAATDSAEYFSRVHEHTHLAPPQFAFNLLTRSGRISHANLAQRDADFVRGVDVWFATDQAEHAIAPPPAFTPLALRGLRLANRMVGGVPRDAGLVLTPLTAVSPGGRVSPDSPTLCADTDVARLRAAVADAHAHGSALGVLLGHAGRRGATRPPERGVDIPLPDDEAWPLLAPSPLSFGPGSQTPRAMTDDDLAEVRDAFVAAAKWAVEAGCGLVALDCGYGYLLASFLSPLTNHRTDDYGGTAENRLRFPLEVAEAVRAALPDDCPLGVRLTVTDWARGGLTPEDGVTAARAFAEMGVDLVHVVAGQTVAESTPEYRRGFLSTLSDRVRNGARVPTLVGGHLTTVDAVNTVLAAGRADLCVAEFLRTPAALTAGRAA